jgi:hypothetical protein
MTEFVVDLSGVTSIADFCAAFNQGFCQFFAGELNELNLDAFNDFLCWPVAEKYRLTFVCWHECRPIHTQIHPVTGRPYAEIILEILQDHPEVEVMID